MAYSVVDTQCRWRMTCNDGFVLLTTIAESRYQRLRIYSPLMKLCSFSWCKHIVRHQVCVGHTCQQYSTSRANRALRSLANAGFLNRGVCLQAFPSFPSPSPHFHFFGSCFIYRGSRGQNPRIPFLGLSLLRNQTKTLATQARSESAAWNWESKTDCCYELNQLPIARHSLLPRRVS